MSGPRAARARRLVAVTVAAAFGLAGCTRGPELRGRIAGLDGIVRQAERDGAMRCAPRELAIARANLEFALVELEQGNVSSAQAHVDVAEPNARALEQLAPADQCAERAIAVVPQVGDRDGDGYLDPEDRCPDAPETWNSFEDLDGCPDDPDTDKDGIVDSRDQCVLEAEDRDSYLDDDGCPEPDNDLDGVLDAVDQCALEPEDPDGYEDADGCPDPDNDRDAVADVDDQCPNEPGPPGGDRPGCPRKSSLVVVTDKEIKITQQIHFEYDKDVIRKESFPILDAVAEVLASNPGIKLEIQGHTDNKGKPDYNLKLSDRRAASVRKYLVGKGIPAARLQSKGYGMTRPLVPNDTDQSRALNRRVQFIRIEGGS